ncbi:uncharacterized protein LOC126831167 [Patella vulgata]|uniref:uncharacterized protein LOC126831167 n=1 Tax=Patella vulgata TaxID=6465 RepID=UPI00217FF0B5|nr:uncharacterized protein LOC126831167 [Patella vulgata]
MATVTFTSLLLICVLVTYTSGASSDIGFNGKNKLLDALLRTIQKTCKIYPAKKDIYENLKQMEADRGTMMYEFHFSMFNYTDDPLTIMYDQLAYKPGKWFRTKTQHGRTLLMLSFHYDILSMSILKIGVEKIPIVIKDEPFGCFNNLTSAKRMELIYEMLLDNFQVGKATKTGTDRSDYVCHLVIRNNTGYAEFVNACCSKEEGVITCSDQLDDKWITLLYLSITLVKFLMFLFFPLFMPTNMYSAVYVASEYVVKLKKALKMTLLITEKTDCHVKFKKRLTLEDVSNFWRFREKLDELPTDEIIPIKMEEIRITVKGKRIIPENEPPTGLLRTAYDNLVRCKIKGLEPFNECCDLSVFASLENSFKHKLTWHSCMQMFVKCMMLFMVPIPFYVRLFIYYKFEHDEMVQRRLAIKEVHLQEQFNYYRTNLMQYFTPTHGLFIAAYCFYFLSGLVIGFSDQQVRDKLKSIARSALQDMSNVSQVGVIQVVLRIGLWPFRKCGLLAILLIPLYIGITAPFTIITFALYCIPIVYISYRIVFQSWKQIGENTPLQEEKKLRFEKLKKIHRRLSRMDMAVHNITEPTEEETCCPSTGGFSMCYTIRTVFLQFVTGAFCLCVLYALALIFAESIGLLVEVLAFTMMGIIVNASSTLKYVTMVLLVFVYMHDCYNNVYENYLQFNKTIIEDMIDRVDDLRKIASLPSSMQENAGFQVKTMAEDPPVKTKLNFTKGEVRWTIGQLLLFLDSHDTPRIPLRLFKKLCEVRVHGAPGPVYLNLLRATGKFLIIVVFLLFVMIVVMAFGNVHKISSTNQTLATLAGGFVPMLLKNVLSSKSVKLSLKTISFKGQIDEIITDYKQHWPVTDIIFEKDEPEEEGEAGENGDDKDKDNDNDKDKDKGKDKDKDIGGEKETKGDKKEDKSAEEKEKDSKEVEKKPNGKIRFSDEIESDSKSDIKQPGAGRTPFDPENEVVDLFIDLSVADAIGGWSMFGSTESLPSDTMMPSYFHQSDPMPPPPSYNSIESPA